MFIIQVLFGAGKHILYTRIVIFSRTFLIFLRFNLRRASRAWKKGDSLCVVFLYFRNIISLTHFFHIVSNVPTPIFSMDFTCFWIINFRKALSLTCAYERVRCFLLSEFSRTIEELQQTSFKTSILGFSHLPSFRLLQKSVMSSFDSSSSIDCNSISKAPFKLVTFSLNNRNKMTVLQLTKLLCWQHSKYSCKRALNCIHGLWQPE